MDETRNPATAAEAAAQTPAPEAPAATGTTVAEPPQPQPGESDEAYWQRMRSEGRLSPDLEARLFGGQGSETTAEPGLADAPISVADRAAAAAAAPEPVAAPTAPNPSWVFGLGVASLAELVQRIDDHADELERRHLVYAAKQLRLAAEQVRRVL